MPFQLNNDQKDYIDGLLNSVSDAFLRPIEIITQGPTVAVRTNPQTRNWNYEKAGNTELKSSDVKTIIQAVVEYSPTVADQNLQLAEGLKAYQDRGLVRISVKQDGRDLLNKYKDIQFDGHSFQVETSDVPRTMFNTNVEYYDFWLVRKS